MTSLRGMQLALLPEVQPYWLENPGRPSPAPVRSGGDAVRSPNSAQMALELPETSPNVCTTVQGGQRRHSPKGKASGWIKERKGNTQRKQATTSYFYCWDEPVQDGQAEYQRHQVYVPVRAIAQVQAMIAERQPVAVVLGVLARGRSLTNEGAKQGPCYVSSIVTGWS